MASISGKVKSLGLFIREKGAGKSSDDGWNANGSAAPAPRNGFGAGGNRGIVFLRLRFLRLLLFKSVCAGGAAAPKRFWSGRNRGTGGIVFLNLRLLLFDPFAR